MENVEEPSSKFMNDNDGEAENWYLLSGTNTFYYAIAMVSVIVSIVDSYTSISLA